MARELLFSVTKKDLAFETFRAGGNGGQKQNKTSSGARVRHAPSGAVAESRSHAGQLANKREAFVRLLDTPEFKLWMKRKTSELMLDADTRERREREIASAVERQMSSDNILEEILDADGNWTPMDCESSG